MLFAAKCSDCPLISLGRSPDKQDLVVLQPEPKRGVRELDPLVEVRSYVVDDVFLGLYVFRYGWRGQGEEGAAIGGTLEA